GLVAVHRDRGEVDEDVVPTLALDEAVALLVREPLDGALSQPVPPSTTNDGPGTEPPNWSRSALSVAQRGDETSPRRARAAFTVLASMRAIVIGPTPPGTGVMWPARSAAPGSTSPTRPPSVRLIPTSITVAPSLIMSAETRPGTPTAATTMSASPTWR